MKTLLVISLLIVISSSCKKQELDTDNPMLGKWQASTVTVESKCPIVPSVPTFSGGKPFKKATVEILSSGLLIVEFDGEVEKLKIIEITESPSMTEFDIQVDAIKKYDCKVKNRIGQVFPFHFYFSENTGQMIGTYWMPDHPYNTIEIPNSTTVYCSWGSQPKGGYDTEFFAVYEKL